MGKLKKRLIDLSARLDEINKGRSVKEIMLSVLYDGDHIHSAYPDDQTLRRKMIRHMAKENHIFGGSEAVDSTKLPETRKVILYQGQSPGDILSMAAAVRDLKLTYPKWQIDVRSPAQEIWDFNPHLSRLDENDPEVEKHYITYDEIHESGWRGHHFTDAFRHDIERKLGCKISKTSILPELYLSSEEQGWINQVEVEFGWSGPFWVINAGYKPDNELKRYPFWEEVVKEFNRRFNGAVRLVQIGHTEHIHPDIPGAYNLVGKTDTRQLIRLTWWAHGTVGPISFQFVMAAALQKPHVVVAGGKEGVRWHLYPHGRYIYTNGALRCCVYDGCWKGGDKGVCIDQMPDGTMRCMNLIKPYMIVDAISMYYEGGVLQTSVRGR